MASQARSTRLLRVATSALLLSVLSLTRRVVSSSAFVAEYGTQTVDRNDINYDDDNRFISLTNAIEELHVHGGFQICLTKTSRDQNGNLLSNRFPDLPNCDETANLLEESPSLRRRSLKESSIIAESTVFTEEQIHNPPWWEAFQEEIVNGICALICISIAALAAGLTLGMLGLDPLLLLIKQRASDDPVERQQATNLLPIVKQHHRLLVTLLLMNAVANEALPIFLEALVPPSLAILFSVVFVLFFGEIIPSAVFTGPRQMTIASNLVPLVKFAMCLLYPVAAPIAKLLDWVLHEEDDGSNVYNRGELSALIRIQYEERLAAKRKRRKEKKLHMHSKHMQLLPNDDNIGALDFSQSFRSRQRQRESFRASKSHLLHEESKLQEQRGPHPKHQNTAHSSAEEPSQRSVSFRSTGGSVTSASVRTETPDSRLYEDTGIKRSNSIHIDEVTMVEGALSMKVKVAMDEFTPLRQVFSIPDTTLLSEKGIVRIYASGFSRIPVYHENPKNKKKKTQIVGVLLCKQLIVVNPEDKRPVSSMPLYTPLCVGPNTPLVDLVNLFQTGGRGMTGGHLALVCARPKIGNEALAVGEPLPDVAGLMGVITLEDVLETLLQEEIYDENDKYERDAHRLSKMVIRRWRRYITRKKKGLIKPSTASQNISNHQQPAMRPVVDQAVAAAAAHELEEGLATETTALLGASESND